MNKIGQTISYYLLLGLCKAVGWLPYWFLYRALVPFIYFFLYPVLHYRRTVVRENLRNSFPERSEAERLDIEKKFYKHLAEIFVDTIAMTSISEKKIRRRFRYLNAEEVERQVSGESWICAMAHYGSWEYTINYPLFTDHRVGAVYHHLHSAVFNRFYYHVRSRFGAIPIERDKVTKEIVRTRRDGKPPLALALIADQNPPGYRILHWFNFLHQPTAFYLGTEKIARKLQLPVYFLDIQKIKRGYYTATFVPIYDGKESVEDFEITTRYVDKLQEMIRRRPELWLWSHRRWKHKPPVRTENEGKD